MRDRRVVEVVRVGVHAPGCNFMQQRLPHVGRHFGRPASRAPDPGGRSRSPSRVASGRPPAPPPTITIRWVSVALTRAAPAHPRASSAHDGAAGIEANRIGKIGRPLDRPRARSRRALPTSSVPTPHCSPSACAAATRGAGKRFRPASGGTACRPCSSRAAARSVGDVPGLQSVATAISHRRGATHRWVAAASRAGIERAGQQHGHGPGTAPSPRCRPATATRDDPPTARHSVRPVQHRPGRRVARRAA